MCGTCGCKSAESGKKNCGCGQDPCKTFGAEEKFVDCNYCGRNIDLYDETNDSISCDECGKIACGSYKCNYSKNPKETWEEFTCGECVAETFEARTTRKGGKMRPTTTVRDGTWIYTDKKDGISMDYDNQKVRKLGKALRRQGVPLKIKTKNAETFGAETHFDIINIEYMEDGEETFDYPEQMFVSVETREDDHYTYTKDSIRTKIKSYVRRNFGNDVEVVDFLAFPEGSNIELGQEFEAETTCASCGEGIDEFDIIGDGTNRGLCCVPDYYDDEPEMVHCSFCSKIIGTEKEVYDEETIDYEVANGETICVSCGEEREKELKNDLDPHYSPFYAETFESPDGYCPRCHVPGNRSTGRMELRCSDCGGGMFAENFEAQNYDDWIIYTSKYDGHTKGPWTLRLTDEGDEYGDIDLYGADGIGITTMTTYENTKELESPSPDVQLIRDAPKILEAYKIQNDVLSTLDEKIRSGDSHADLMRTLEQELGLTETWDEMGAETEKPFWENITMSSKKKKDFSPLYHGLIAGALGVVALKIMDRVKK